MYVPVNYVYRMCSISMVGGSTIVFDNLYSASAHSSVTDLDASSCNGFSACDPVLSSTVNRGHLFVSDTHDCSVCQWMESINWRNCYRELQPKCYGIWVCMSILVSFVAYLNTFGAYPHA